MIIISLVVISLSALSTLKTFINLITIICYTLTVEKPRYSKTEYKISIFLRKPDRWLKLKINFFIIL